MKEVSNDKYIQILELQKTNGINYSEHYKGSKKILMVDNRIVCATYFGNMLDLGNLDKNRFVSFIASFKRGLYKQFDNNRSLITHKVYFDGLSKQSNKKAFANMDPGKKFWNLDLSSAYWQIGFRLGYISKSFYSKYILEDDFKHAKRLCFSFLARQNVKKYTYNGLEYTIECDNTIERAIYDNVRNELYLLIDRARQIAGENCLQHNIDGISVNCQNKKQLIEEFFKGEGLSYKVNDCIKIDDKQYLFKSKIKRF